MKRIIKILVNTPKVVAKIPKNLLVTSPAAANGLVPYSRKPAIKNKKSGEYFKIRISK
jgi:hypothetical protein